MKPLIQLFVVVFLSKNLIATEAIGFYSNGSLKNSESIMDKNFNIHKLFNQRQKFYSTNEIIDLISDSSSFLNSQFQNCEPLQIGDLSPKSGGNAPGHSSHQNGLDVDIVYLTNNQKIQSNTAVYWEEDFVQNGKLSANFNIERNLLLFKFLINQNRVERIFVDRIIKKNLCDYSSKNGLMKDPQIIETLRRLRPQDLHSTHFHVRMFCPTSDINCTSQAPVPYGHGCDDLDIISNQSEQIPSC